MLRELADATHVATGTRRVGDAAGHEEAAGVRVADVEQLVGVAVEAAGEDAGRDAELVHQCDEGVDAERAFVAAEVAGDVRVLLGAEELRGRLFGDEVHPDVDDVHLSSALGAARRGQGS